MLEAIHTGEVIRYTTPIPVFDWSIVACRGETMEA